MVENDDDVPTKSGKVLLSVMNGEKFYIVKCTITMKNIVKVT